MANAWDALLNNNPTPVDPFRNADYDKAFGYDEQDGDSGSVKFAKGLMSSMSRNTPEGRDATLALAKQKMANQLALQLEQQKLQLRQQYPEYHIERTPYGAIAINPYNPKDQVQSESYPGAAKDFGLLQQAQQKGEMAEAATKADPAYQKAKLDEAQAEPGLKEAQTQYYKDRGPLEQAKADATHVRELLQQQTGARAAAGPAPKRSDIEKEVLARYNIKPGSPLNDEEDLKKADAEIEIRYNKALQDWRASAGSSINPQAPQAPAAPKEIPDFSGLMTPLGQE